MTTATARRRAATAPTPARSMTAAPRKPNRRQASTKASAPNKTAAADKPSQRQPSQRQPSQRQPSTEIAARNGPRRPVGRALLAAERAVQRNSLHVQLPIVGELRLPAPEQVAFLGGVAVLVVIGVLEWPVAALLGLGHGLAINHHNKLVRAFGEAMEEA